ncbi:amidohydrolase 3 [Macroventuria anomochaeta]|uniref:Amidohydrolase 3 n=1 Tax=Macroventuria anomochaeta TaxID=301207 RepID=A0ACB6S6R9_9PLEO|nr:amidohydrolase 3 [Macroventuria anomochaeta]KAF2629702.1 amidohydrolase 3 [Macroventuria anomochaeta]
MAGNRVFVNGRIFASSDAQKETTDFVDCMVLEGDKISHVGSRSDESVQEIIQNGAAVVDLEDRVIIPGFIDAHTHLLFFGLSLRKLDLTNCTSLGLVRSAISDYAKKHPEMPRVLCRGWHQPSTGRLALATMLDDLDVQHRPIYVEALDLHSTWVNTAALRELPLKEAKELGNHQIPCDENGNPTGLFAEAGQTDIVWPYLNEKYTEEEKQAALQEAFDAYIAAGYTGAIDMAMDDNSWDALQLYRKRNGTLPIHVAAHWLVRPAGNLEAQVDAAISQNEQWHPSSTPDFCVVGIKMICDGVVDGCTAALTQAYPGHANLIDPLFTKDQMEMVVTKAARANLQVAIHAIGNAAISQAISSIASANTPSGRHRIEHLEITNSEDAKRLGALGITASVQPVHSDPAILIDYQKLIGPHLWDRAFAYKEFLDSHACVAFGTDAPTARHLPLPNLYNATMRRSATQPQMTERTTPHQALTMSQAFYAATAGAAYSRFAEKWTGSLKKGLRADFVVLDSKWTPESLLDDTVAETWARGRRVYRAVQQA